MATDDSHGKYRQKLSALITEDDLAKGAQQGDRAKFDRVMAKVAKRPPQAGDKLN